MINKLSKEKYFKYDSKELLGVMRFDFYDGRLSNQWNPRELIIKMNDRKLIDLKKLQQELNYIQFTLIEEFNKVVELCNGTGYDKETLVYIELEEGKYVIKLIPVKDSYSSDLRTVIIQLIGSIYFNKKIILKNIKNHLFIV